MTMGVPDPTKELVNKKGIRLDGRKADQIRPITIEAGILHRADGSAYLEWGGNKVICAVYGPRELNPKRFQESDKAVVQVRYGMSAFSTSDRKRPGPDRRSQEISKVIADAFENVVLTEKYPRGAIDVQVQVLEAAAGTRCAALTVAAVALADAGIPMKGLVSAVAAGKCNDHVILDLMQEEDNYGNADLPVGINHTTGEIVLLQMDGHLTPAEFEKALDMAVEGNQQVVKVQRDALLRRFHATLDAQEVA
jgi:exosome complex component RRP41